MSKFQIPPSQNESLRLMELAIMVLIHGIQDGMTLSEALGLIHDELKRLKEIEWKYEELCK